MLLALDPSVRSPGMALFRNDVLSSAGRLTIKRSKIPGIACSDGQWWLTVAHDILKWVGPVAVRTLVFEKPQIYTAYKSKGDPNDLVGLAGVAAAVAGMLRWHGPLEVFSPTPAEWIGQLPKTTRGSAKESPRAKRILSRLSPAELALVPDQHDAIDAVGIGLWCLGRLTPRTTFSNGHDGR